MTIKFSTALEELKNGKRVARYGWREGEFLYLVRGSTFQVNRPPLSDLLAEGTQVQYLPHIDKMVTLYEPGTDQKKVYSYVSQVWVPTTEELISENWRVIEDA